MQNAGWVLRLYHISYPSLFLLVSGDSGGPLLIKGKTDDEDLQVGIVSW
jgi:hypothetical protein